MLFLFIKMLPLIFLTLAGYTLNRLKWIDAGFNRQLSHVMLNFFYPCLIISTILRTFTWETLIQNWGMPTGTVLILLTGWVIGLVTLPLLKRQPQATRRSYHFVCLMNNYSFLPILMAAALWGEKSMARVIFAGLGAELCVWTLGIKALTGQKLGWRSCRNLFSVPMMALLSSCLLVALRSVCTRFNLVPEGTTSEFLKTLLESCRMAGGATIPASALICGARIAMLHPHNLASPLMAGTCLLRLVVTPALCIAGLLLLPIPAEIRRVLILIAVQPAAMASVSLTEAYGGDSDFSAAAVLTSHLLCLVTIPLWLGYAL